MRTDDHRRWPGGRLEVPAPFRDQLTVTSKDDCLGWIWGHVHRDVATTVVVEGLDDELSRHGRLRHQPPCRQRPDKRGQGREQQDRIDVADQWPDSWASRMSQRATRPRRSDITPSAPRCSMAALASTSPIADAIRATLARLPRSVATHASASSRMRPRLLSSSSSCWRRSFAPCDLLDHNVRLQVAVP